MPLLKIQKPYIFFCLWASMLNYIQQQILEQHGFQYQVISKLFKTLVQNLVQFKSDGKSALFSDQNLQSNNISGRSNSFLKDYLPTYSYFFAQRVLSSKNTVSTR